MRIQVTVKPGAKRESVEEIASSQFRVSVKAPPQEGKANAAVIGALAAHFRVPKSAVEIVGGAVGRHKWVEIDLSSGKDVIASGAKQSSSGSPRSTSFRSR